MDGAKDYYTKQSRTFARAIAADVNDGSVHVIEADCDEVTLEGDFCRSWSSC